MTWSLLTGCVRNGVSRVSTVHNTSLDHEEEPTLNTKIHVSPLIHRTMAGVVALPLAGALTLAYTPPASAAEQCSLVDYGTTGFYGDIASDAGAGWANDVNVIPTGYSADWGNLNDTAIGQELSHDVTGLSATSPEIQFDAYWRQATNSDPANTESTRLHVYYDGVLYATIETPGPDNQHQRAITTTYNGATLSPAFPDRASGLSGSTWVTFSLTLPEGVPADATLTFSMSQTHANGTSTSGAADDFWLNNISANECEEEVGVPVVDPLVAGGLLGVAAVGVGAWALRRRGDASGQPA